MVTFDKEELVKFSLEELKKMMDIQIKNEKFEGAVLIRDVIDERKKGYGIDTGENDDDAEIL